jgi:hypothetical protein
MRAAPPGYPERLSRYSAIGLPAADDSARRGSGFRGDAARSARDPIEVVGVPLRGGLQEQAEEARAFGASRAELRRLRRALRAERAEAAGQLERSRYGDVYRLARRVVAGAPTTYDAVKRVERHLQENYRYSEQPPTRDLPLHAFLFQDRIGYCQHFSGAMALMLRMNGIPARVAAGFSPGSFNRETREYRVRDLDAHSWVEVYFSDIGWVPFDPTPPVAPAESQSSGAGAISAASAAGIEQGQGERGRSSSALSERAGGAGAPTDDSGGLGAWAVPLALLGAVALVGGGGFMASLVRRRRLPADPVEAEIHELRGALRRLGYGVPPGTTLRALEERLRRVAGPGAARYVRRLRALRYERSGARPAGRGERRELRRSLTRRRGPLTKLRGLLALPPLPPRFKLR